MRAHPAFPGTPASATRRIDRLEVLRLERDARPSRFRAPGFLLIAVSRGSARLPGGAVAAAGSLAVIAAGTRDALELGSDLDAAMIVIPTEAAGPHIPSLEAVSGRAIPADVGTAALVAEMVRALATPSDHGATAHPARLAEHIVGLVALMCQDACRDQSYWRDGLLRRAVDHIEEHLSDVDLTPQSIADAMNVSTRTLHRIFEREGRTIAGWIRTRRLERARADLADPALAELSVSAIGGRCGLWDAAHFSRAFKSAFGVSPRVHRAQAFARSEVEPRVARRTA